MSTRPHYELYAIVHGHLVSTINWLRLRLESLRSASQNHNEASYNALNKEEYDSDDLHPTIGRPPLTWRCLALGLAERLVWMLCSAVLLSVVVIQHFNTQMHSYETGFATDLAVATPHIAIQEIVYTGGVVRNDEGKLVLDHSGASTIYVGEPSAELDESWDRLESAIEITLQSHEAKTKDGQMLDTMQSEGEYRTSLDVVHSLHCLNQLRKVLYREYYFPNRPNEFFYTHMNHCIDHLRQALQCHADLTPLNYKWSEEHDRALPTWSSKHTCRDFDKMLRWDFTMTGKPLSETKEYKSHQGS
ncbi:Putative mycotoxin biosynthesis protein UstYa [Colletotrichum destructivum]|uniref:Mycotoxin biosynthesis protein UstYa n=1 Tax=Colletotrichum destructivum TaxID=34406 RepID=A0AAX4ILF3_9PEZI|nr:Putative mycotoxin biosynthesis protein UstYa [Colletotrichum destructivum]